MIYVHVYRNLHKNCFSIRHKGRVIAHANTVLLSDCTFVVQPAGHRKVLETGQKNVHAYVKGILMEADIQDWVAPVPLSYVRYNPHVAGYWHHPDAPLTPVTQADWALLGESRCYVPSYP